MRCFQDLLHMFKMLKSLKMFEEVVGFGILLPQAGGPCGRFALRWHTCQESQKMENQLVTPALQDDEASLG